MESWPRIRSCITVQIIADSMRLEKRRLLEMEACAASQDFWMQDKGMYGILVALERKKTAYEPYRIHTKHNRRRFPMKIKVSNYIAGKLVEIGRAHV